MVFTAYMCVIQIKCYKSSAIVLDGKSFDLPSMLLRKEAYVAVPVTAPTAAGLLLVVFTLKPLGPQTSTSTMCQSVILWKS